MLIYKHKKRFQNVSYYLRKLRLLQFRNRNILGRLKILKQISVLF